MLREFAKIIHIRAYILIFFISLRQTFNNNYGEIRYVSPFRGVETKLHDWLQTRRFSHDAYLTVKYFKIFERETFDSHGSGLE